MAWLSKRKFRMGWMSLLALMCIFGAGNIDAQSTSEAEEDEIDFSTDAGVTEAIDEAMNEESYELQTYGLWDVSFYAEGDYADATKEKFYVALTDLFNAREKYYEQKHYLSDLFSEALVRGNLLSGNKKSDVVEKNDTITLETFILKLKEKVSLGDINSELQRIINRSKNKIFSSKVQGIFFDNLVIAVNNRAGESARSLSSLSAARKLIELINDAASTNLISATDKPKADRLARHIQLEVDITGLKGKTIRDMVVGIVTAMEKYPSDTFGEITQNIAMESVKAVVPLKNQNHTVDELAGSIVPNVREMLEKAKDASLFALHKTAIAAFLTVLTFENSIVTARLLQDVDKLLEAVNVLIGIIGSGNVEKSGQILFADLLEKLFSRRRPDEKKSLEDVQRALVASRSSALTNNESRARISNMLQIIQQELDAVALVQRLRDILELPDNQNQERIVRLKVVLTEVVSLTLLPPTKQLLLDAVERSFDRRARITSSATNAQLAALITQLTNLKNMLGDAAQSSQLVEKKTLIEEWIGIVSQEMEVARVVTEPTWPNVSPGPGWPKPLNDPEQDLLFKRLQQAYNDRVKTIPALTSLKELLITWRAYVNQQNQTTINQTWIPQIDRELQELKNDELIDRDGSENDPDKLTYPLTPGQQNKIFEKLQRRYNARTQQKSVLEGLKTLLLSWIPPVRDVLTASQNTTISGVWIPTLDREIGLLKNDELIDKDGSENDPDKLTYPLTPGQQNKIFEKLQRRYNARTPQKEALEGLKALLLSWIPPVRDALTSSQNATISGVWIPTINKEIALLQGATTWPPSVPGPDNLPLPDTYEEMYFNTLKQRYESRDRNSEQALVDLKGVLNQWATSGALKPAHTQEITTIWMPTIDKEIALLRYIKGGGTGPDEKPPKLVELPPLTPEQVDALFSKLEKDYQGRDRTSIEKLTTLKGSLEEYVAPNTPLKPHQITTISTVWIPTINKEIALLHGTTTWPPPVPGPDNLPLPDTYEEMYFNTLKQRYESRDRNSEQALVDLKGVLNQWATSGALKPAHTQEITTIWMPTIDKEIALLRYIKGGGTGPDEKPPKLVELPPLTPEQVDALFSKLEKDYQGRDRTSIEKLTTLKGSLEEYVAPNTPLKPQQMTTISTVWIPTINKEIALLQGATTWPPPVPGPDNIPLPDTYEEMYFNMLKQRYESRDRNSEQALVDLKGVLNQWATSGALKPAHNQEITTIWIPTIDKEIALLRYIKGGGTGPDEKPPKPGDLPPLTPEQVDALFSQLEKDYQGRDRTSIEKLTTLKGSLEEYVAPASPLKPQQMTTISTVWIPTINKEIAYLNFIKPGPIEPWPSYPGGLPETLTDDEAAKLFQKLEAYYQSRNPQSSQSLTTVRANLVPWSTDHGRLQGREVTIATIWIPQIDKEIRLLKVVGDPFDPTFYPVDPKIGPLTPDQQNSIFEQLQKAYNERQKNEPALRDLSQKLQSWLDSLLLSQVQNTTIRDTWLPTIAAEIREIVFIAAINNALRITEYQQFMSALKQIMDDAGQLTFTSQVQQLFFNAITIAFNQRVGVAAALITQLISLLQQATTTPLLSEADRVTVGTWITSIQTEQGMQEIMRLIDEALALTDYKAQLDATKIILDKGVGLTVNSTVQNKFFSLLQKEYYARTGQGAPIFELLIVIFTAAQTSSLLSPEQQNIVAKALETLMLDLAMMKAHVIEDYESLLDALYNIIFQYAHVQNVASSVQNMFYTSLQKVFVKRGQEYDVTKKTLDAININKLALLLSKAADSILVIAQNRPTVELYSQIVILEQMLTDIPKKTDYTTQLNDMFKVVRVAEGRTYDQVTHYVYFNILKSLYEKRDASQKAQLEILIQVLTRSLTTALLNTQGQQEVKRWLEGLGQTPGAVTPVQQGVWDVLAQDTLQQKLENLMTFLQSLAGKKLTSTEQNQIAATIQQLYTEVMATQDPQVRALFNNVLTRVVELNILAPLQRNYVIGTLMPSVSQIIPEQGWQDEDLWDLDADDGQTASVVVTPGKSALITKPKDVKPVAPTSKNITAAINRKTVSARADGLLQVAKGVARAKKRVSPSVINALLASTEKLAGEAQTMSYQDASVYAQLLGELARSKGLTATQKKRVYEHLIPQLLTDLSKQTTSDALISALSILGKELGKDTPMVTRKAIEAAVAELERRFKAGLLNEDQKRAYVQLLEVVGSSAGFSTVPKATVKTAVDIAQGKDISTHDIITQTTRKIAVSKTPQERIEALDELNKKLSGRMLTAEEKNAVAATIVQVNSHVATGSDNVTQGKLRKTLEEIVKTNIIGDAQKEYVNKTLIPPLAKPAPEKETASAIKKPTSKKPTAAVEAAPAIASTVSAALAQPTVGKKVEGLKQAVDQVKGKKVSSVDAKAVVEAAAALNKHVKTMSAQELVAQAHVLGTASGLAGLSASQVKEVQDTLIPAYVKELIALKDTQSIIQATRELHASLGTSGSAATKNALASVVNELQKRYDAGQMSESEKQAFIALLDEMGESAVMTSAQKTYTKQLSAKVQGKDVAISQDKAPVATTPSKKVIKKPTSKKRVKKTTSKAPTSKKPTAAVKAAPAIASTVSAALAQPTVGKKVEGLKQAVDQVKGKKVSSVDAKAVVEAAATLNKNVKTMSAQELVAQAHVLGTASGLAGLSASQVKEVQDTLIPAYVKELIALKDTQSIIQATRELHASLGTSGSAATKNALASVVNELQKRYDAGQMSESEKQAFIALLDEMGESAVMTSAQKTYTKQLSAKVQGKDVAISQDKAPVATTPSKKVIKKPTSKKRVKKTTSKAPTSKKPTAAVEAAPAIASTVSAALAQPTVGKKVEGLKQAVDQVKGKKVSSADAKAVVEAAATLNKNVKTMSAQELVAQAHVLGTASGLAGLSASQVKEVQDTLIPAYVKELIALKDTQSIIQATRELHASLGTSGSAATKNALASVVNELQKRYDAGQMSESEKQAFIALLDEMGESAVMTSAQKTYTKQLSAKVQGKDVAISQDKAPVATTPSKKISKKPTSKKRVKKTSKKPTSKKPTAAVKAAPAITSTVSAALAQPTVGKKVEGLKQAVDQVKGKRVSSADAKVVVEAAAALNKHVKTMSAQELVAQAHVLGTASGLAGLSASQVKEVQDTLIPAYVKELVASKDTQSIIQATRELHASLGTSGSAATKNALASVVNELQKRYDAGQMSESEKQAFVALLDEMGESAVMTSAQKTYTKQLSAKVQGKDVTISQGTAPVATTPSKKISKKPTSKKRVKKTSKKPTSKKPTAAVEAAPAIASTVSAALAQPTVGKKVEGLKQAVDQVKGKKVSSADAQAVVEAAAALNKHVKTMSAQELVAQAHVLGTASGLAGLNASQVKEVQDTLIPAYVKELVASKDTQSIIQATRELHASLGTSGSAATKNALASVVNELQKRYDAGQMSESEKQAFIALLDEMGESAKKPTKKIRRKRMKKTSKKTTTGRATGRQASTVELQKSSRIPEKVALRKDKFGKSIKTLTMPTPQVQASLMSLMRLLQGKTSFRSKMSTLHDLINVAQGVKIPATLQNDFSKILVALFNEVPAGDRGVIELFINHINNLQTIDLLSDRQKEWSLKTLLPMVQKKAR